MGRSKLEKQARQLATIAHHEAGHSVAAFHVGLETKALSIVSKDYRNNATYFSDKHVVPLTAGELPGDIKMRHENFAFVCLAGPWAQREFNPKGFRKVHAESDSHQAIGFLGRVRNDNESLELYLKRLDLEACNFFRDKFKWGVICHLAGVLLNQPEMTGDEVRKAIMSGYHIP